MKYLHGVVAVHVKSNNIDQAASSFPFCREFSKNHLEWAWKWSMFQLDASKINNGWVNV
jgi:hypothetical protein